MRATIRTSKTTRNLTRSKIYATTMSSKYEYTIIFNYGLVCYYTLIQSSLLLGTYKCNAVCDIINLNKIIVDAWFELNCLFGLLYALAHSLNL